MERDQIKETKTMKKICFTLCFVFACLLVNIRSSHSFCLVSSESGGSKNIYSLSYAVSKKYSGKGSGAICTTGSTDSYDDYYGLAQAILFATLEWGYSNDVNEIILKSALNFDNSDENLVIGNFSEETPPTDVDYAYDYAAVADSGTYVPVVDDYGIVTINAQDNFDPGEQPFTFASGTKEVILRNLIILTDGIDKDKFFSNASCLRDGGAVTVDPGETVEEDTDADGDEY